MPGAREQALGEPLLLPLFQLTTLVVLVADLIEAKTRYRATSATNQDGRGPK
jgi:hypothetical protein